MNFTPKAILFILICVVAGFFAWREDQQGALDSTNRTYVDWLIGNSDQEIQPPSVTLLRLDEADRVIYQTWPPSPLAYAAMLDNLAKHHDPKVVAVQPVLNWSDASEGLVDTLHTAALHFDGNQLLLGAELQLNAAAPPLKEATLSLLRPLPNVQGEREKIPEFTSVLNLPHPRVAALGTPTAFTRIDLGEATPTDDGLAVPLVARVGDVVVPSFVLLAAMLDMDAAPEDVRISLGQRIEIKDTHSIPIDASGALRVSADLRGRVPISNANILVWDPSATEGGLADVLDQGERASLKSRVLLLGMDDERARTIPAGQDEKISSAELFALAIATIQTGRYPEKVPPFVEWIVWAVLVLIGLLLLRRRRGRAFGLALLCVILYFAASMILFKTTPRWVPPAVPFTLLACMALGALLLASGREVEVTEAENAAK